ncbi:MAG TPA: enoyl-CoA hydratase/isomerase family protein [Allosphingosinicella sp.]|nr:enoyl-CoA hydratase/isomerase family protein [Allosphingosinicella sp.]
MFELTLEGAFARLRLDRPEARNAIPVHGWALLSHRCGEAARAGARLLVLSGTCDAFCAGADLGDFHGFTTDPESVTSFRRLMRTGLDALRDLPFTTVAAIEGPCFGAGVALAMACDVRIAAPSARFAITPAKFGISFPQEDVARLVALIGPGQASRLLLGAGTSDSAEAARIGLIELLAPDVGLAVDAFAAAVLANSAESVALLKRGIGLAVEGRAHDPGQDRSFDSLFGSADFRERLAALRPGR